MVFKFDNILLGPPNNVPTNQAKIGPWAQNQASPCSAACTPEASCSPPEIPEQSLKALWTVCEGVMGKDKEAFITPNSNA